MARLDFKTPSKTFKILKKIKGDIDNAQLVLTDNDGKQYILFKGKVDIDQNKVDPNTPPTCYAGEDITVKPGDPIILDGTVSDKEDATITNVIWKQVLVNPEDPQLQLQADTVDATKVTSTAPEIREGKKFEFFEFLLEATDSGGLTTKDTCTVTVTPDGKPIPPDPQPTTNVIWDSHNPEFADGKAERIDVGSQNHYMGWKTDGIVASHAGATRAYKKDGKGGFSISGARARMYPLGMQENVEHTTYITANNSLANTTLNSRSDHNEGGAPEHRFGGLQSHFEFDKQSVGWKVELYHNVHMTVKDTKLPSNIKLIYGKRQGLRTRVWTDKNGSIQLRSFIDQNNDGNFVEICNAEVKNPKPYFLGKKHYGWERTNGSNPQEILYEDTLLVEIEPPS